jgi:Fe-S cluster assembly protein SufD
MSVAIAEKTLTTEVASFIEQSLNAKSADYSIRKEALEAFRKLGFPPAKSEEYKFTPLTRVLEKNLKPGASVNTQRQDASEFAIPGLDAHVLVIANGRLIQNNFVSTAELTIQPLSEALESNTELVQKYFAKVVDHQVDPFAAWNTSSWSDGLFIRITDNKVIEKPIVLYYVQDAKEGQVIAVNRNLIVAGTNSEVTIIEKFDSTQESSFNFSNTVNEVVVGENAGVNFYSIQNDQGGRHQFGLTQFHQSNHSRVNSFTFTLDGKLVRNNLHLTLDGEGIESHMYGLYLLTHDTLADNHTVVDHRKPNSFSNEMYKGIMDENSKGVFNGKIYVRPDAQKTNAFQANRNILLTDKATVNTKPQLEIWADDVKCSHGCTSGQLDEEALFYLQTRGIHKETAQAMMLYAFAGELLESIKNPVIKEYLDDVISERLHKNF